MSFVVRYRSIKLRKLKIISSVILVCGTFSVSANNIDSLLKIDLSSAHDTVVFYINYNLAEAYYATGKTGDDISGKKHLDKSLQIAIDQKNLAHEIKTRKLRAHLFQQNNQLNECVQEYKKLEKLYVKTGDHAGRANAVYRIAGAYFYSSQINTAIKYGKKYMELAKTLNSKSSLARGYMLMGVLYSNTHKNEKEAEECFLEEIRLKKETGDSSKLGISYNNLGSFLIGVNRLAEAELFLRLAIDMGIKYRDSLVVAYGSFELGNLYARQLKWKRANESYATALNIWEKTREDNHRVQGYLRYAQSLYNSGNAVDGYRYLEKYLKLSALNDSLQNVETLNTLEAKYQGEKNARENKILTQKDKLREARYQQSQLVLWAVSGGLLLVLFLMFFIYRGLRQKKTANKKLAESYSLLEEKNNEILGSIYYAKRIQDALLKEDKFLKDCTIEHFILFAPRDIVSGDFYWSMRENDFMYVAVADCTGHGVPGALLTMLGSSFLNEMVSLSPGIGTAELLNGLRERVIRELNQEASFDSTRDGMDISIARINLKTYEICWSGANSPLWIVKSEERREKSGNAAQNNASLLSLSSSFHEVKADKQPVGFSHHMIPFSEHHLTLEKGDQLYFFSDGYADQFGGEKLKKLKSSNFKKLIAQYAVHSPAEQKKQLALFFEDWKAGHEQLDDVCVAGLRL